MSLTRIWRFPTTDPKTRQTFFYALSGFCIGMAVNQYFDPLQVFDINYPGKGSENLGTRSENFWRGRWEAARRTGTVDGSIADELVRMKENKLYRVRPRAAKAWLEYEDEFERWRGRQGVRVIVSEGPGKKGAGGVKEGATRSAVVKSNKGGGDIIAAMAVAAGLICIASIIDSPRR